MNLKEVFNIQKEIFSKEVNQSPRNLKIYSIFIKKINFILKKYTKEALILDCGGFDGKVSFNFNAVILDLVIPALKIAQKNKKMVVCGDIHTMPFKKNIFKNVLICSVLEHSPFPANILKEVSRILKKNGILILVIPNSASVSQIIKLVRYGEVKPCGNHPLMPPEHYHHYTLENIQEIIQTTDFKVIEILGDFVYLPFGEKLKLYKTMFYLGNKFPKLSNNFIIICQKI